MEKSMLSIVAASFVAALAAPPHARASDVQPAARVGAGVCYTVDELGPVYYEWLDLQSLGINAGGTVVGATFRWTGDRSGLVYRKGSITQLGTLGGGLSDARAVNAGGYVVGGSRTADGLYRAASFYQGKVTDLGSLEEGSFSWAMDVNGAGFAVGDAILSGVPHAAAFFLGHVFDLGVLGGETYANGVNDLFDVVGTGRNADGTWRGFLLRAGGTMQEVGFTGASGLSSTAIKINNRGEVCGAGDTIDGEYRGFVHRDGETMMLANQGTPVPYGFSACLDISETGTAVGIASDPTGWDWVAAVWPDPSADPIDLNTRIPPDQAANFWLFEGAAINAAGQIAAYGWSFVSNQQEGYLLSPLSCPQR